ncbi:MAG: PEP-CTERM sorting domain-containing protein [Acidobacteriota bacterium]|jgi:hypothetical protein
MKIKHHSFSLLLGTLLAAISPCAASTIVYLRDAPPAGDFYHNGLYLSGAGSLGANSVRAGLFELQASFNDLPGSYFNLLTYCIDPYIPLSVAPAGDSGYAFQWISPNEYGFSQALTRKLQKLWGNAFADAQASPTAAAAFQFLVWEYIADPIFDFSAGHVQLNNPDVLAQALTWHSQLPSWTSNVLLHVFDGRSASRQSFLLYENTMPMAENPEPSTWLMLGAGLLALHRSRR